MDHSHENSITLAGKWFLLLVPSLICGSSAELGRAGSCDHSSLTLELRVGRHATLVPGGSREFVISELKCAKRDLDRWLIAHPGDYQISAIISTRAMAVKSGEAAAQALDARDFDFSLKGYEVLTISSNPVF